MILNSNQIFSLTKEIEPLITLGQIQQIDSFFIHKIYVLHIYKKQLNKLFISLNRKVGIGLFLETDSQYKIYNKLKLKNDTTRFSFSFKRYLKNSHLLNISIVNSDRILKITLSQEKLFYLIFILIPGKENFILLDQENKIIQCFYYNDLFKNQTYFDFKIFERKIQNYSLIETKTYSNQEIKNYFLNIIFQIQKKNILSEIKKDIEKNILLIDELKVELLKNKKFDLFELQGNLIKLHPYLFKKYEKNIELDNFYEIENNQIPKINIALDETKTIKDNMELFFKKSKKFKASLMQIENRLDRLSHKTNELKNMENTIQNLTGFHDLENIEDLKIDFFSLNSKQLPIHPKKKEKLKSLFSSYTNSSGKKFFFGRNKNENHNLTFHFAKSFDIWLHTHNYPGSHVIIRMNNKNEVLTQETLLDAAHIALKQSKASSFKSEDVVYTKVKYLQRTQELGKVSIKKFKTIHISFDEQRYNNLKK